MGHHPRFGHKCVYIKLEYGHILGVRIARKYLKILSNTSLISIALILQMFNAPRECMEDHTITYDLTRQTALITGASNGLGERFASTLS